MTAEDALIELLNRVAALQGGSALISAHELAQWPDVAVATMKAKKLIKRVRPASSIVCPGCEEECVMPVHANPISSGEPVLFIICDKRDDISRVPVPSAELERWQASGDTVADLLATLLGLQRTSMVSSPDRWEVGVFRGVKHASHLALLAGEKLTLTLSGHSIALSEALTLDGDTFKVDSRRLTSLVDHPVASAGDVESAEHRRERITNRVNELKAKGVKAFLKTVAEEEGLSTSRIKQLIRKDYPQKSKNSTW